MEKLSIKTQNKKGTQAQYKENLALGVLFLNDSLGISIDLRGFGRDYRQRDNAEIRISIDGKILFAGNQQELKQILTNNHKNIW